MDIRDTLHTAIPFLVLAIAFAALAGHVGDGFITANESLGLVVADQLYKGGTLYCSDWGSAQLYGPLFLPVYMLWLAINGSVSGTAYFFRILFLAVDFAVALAATQVLARSMERTVAFCVSLAYLLVAAANLSVLGPYSLALTCAFAAVLFGYCTWLRWLDDDGTQKGYARVLQPFAAGFFAFLAIVFCSWSAIIAILIAAVVAARAFKAEGATGLMPVVWSLAGFAVALICYLILVMGYAEPAAVFGGIASALFVCENLGDSIILLALAGAACIAVAATFFLELNIERNGFEKIEFGAAACALVLALACQGVIIGGSLTAANTTVLEEGPAANLVASQEDTASYAGIGDLLVRVNDAEPIAVYANNLWPYLAAKGVHDSSQESKWMLVSSDGIQVDFDESFQDDYLPIASNGAGTLYQHVGEKSIISSANS